MKNLRKGYRVFLKFFTPLILVSACSDDISGIVVEMEQEIVEVEEEFVEVSTFKNSGEYGFGIVDADIEIATWADFKSAAITHTWDDSSTNQIEVAVPIFDSFSFNTTLFALPNNINDWNKYREAYANGHEVASHSKSHPSFREISETEIINELSVSRELITKNMDYNECLTFAYPFCKDESLGLTEQYYIAARECNNSLNSRTPEDFMKINSYICGEGSNYQTSEDFNKIASDALVSKAWGIYLFHVIDQSGFSPITSEALIEHLSFLKDNGDQYWVDTFLNVVKYIKERDAIEINVIVDDVDEITLKMTDGLDNSVYNSTVTLKKRIPNSWYSKALQIVQANEIIDYNLVSIDDVQFVIFNAVPDMGNIDIKLK